jgi:opacity protein-like surface antigen
MKKLLTYSLAFIFVFVIHSTAVAQTTVGGGLAYGENIEEIGLKIDGIYTINEDFRAGADIIYYFTGEGITFWELNLNGNYLFVKEDDLIVYALAGINYARQSFDFDGMNDVSNSELGLNIGAGLEYDLDFAKLAPEIKYALSDYDQLVVSVGLRFPIN